MFEDALLIDAAGRPTMQHHQAFSRDWDRIKEWSDNIYMPYTVTPIGSRLKPASDMYSAAVGKIDVTRFCYGIPVSVGECSPEAGNILVLTTIRGNGRHALGRGAAANTAVGETFVADCSRTDYFVEFDEDHLQLNLTVPHQLVADHAQQWYGAVPDDLLWRHKCTIGGRGSSWLALMDYVVRAIAESPDAMSSERLGARVQELITAQLLDEWATQAGLQLGADVAPPNRHTCDRRRSTSIPSRARCRRRPRSPLRWVSVSGRSLRDFDGTETPRRGNDCARVGWRGYAANCCVPMGEPSPKSQTPGATSIWACLQPPTGNGSESCLPRRGTHSEGSCLNGHDDRFTHSMNCNDPLFRVGAFCKD